MQTSIIPSKLNCPKTLSILGSTGSIGKNTIDLITANPESFLVDTLVANSNIELLAEQAKSLNVKHVVIADDRCYAGLGNLLSGTGITIASGMEAVVEASQRPVDLLISAIVGAAGLKPTLAAIHTGIDIALANKECLVCAGNLMMEEVQRHNVSLLPVDSEHNAIYQVLETNNRDSLMRLILTASGGPFREKNRSELETITPEEAIAHPNWSMGAKISVDSATMMNKALEIIEAHYLFDMPEDKIDVLIHPQSIVHSMVEYQDGSVLSQMGTPDMRTPIAYSLAWPERMKTTGKRLDFDGIQALTFQKPDIERFPALKLAREALKMGGGLTTILNGANEIAVESFLNKKMPFLNIENVVEKTMNAIGVQKISSIEDVLELDFESRKVAQGYIN